MRNICYGMFLCFVGILFAGQSCPMEVPPWGDCPYDLSDGLNKDSNQTLVDLQREIVVLQGQIRRFRGLRSAFKNSEIIVDLQVRLLEAMESLDDLLNAYLEEAESQKSLVVKFKTFLGLSKSDEDFFTIHENEIKELATVCKLLGDYKNPSERGRITPQQIASALDTVLPLIVMIQEHFVNKIDLVSSSDGSQDEQTIKFYKKALLYSSVLGGAVFATIWLGNSYGWWYILPDVSLRDVLLVAKSLL